MSAPDRSLERFVDAQDRDGTFHAAVAELRRGRKTSHWMWFVFPQLHGLGSSATATHFAITGLDEARAYLAHPVLGPRLVECAEILLGLPTSDAVEVLGSIDAQKLRSSVTLFSLADPQIEAFRAVLDRYFGGQHDPRTVAILES